MYILVQTATILVQMCPQYPKEQSCQNVHSLTPSFGLADSPFPTTPENSEKDTRGKNKIECYM